MEIKLQQRLSQQMVMTPQMQQAMKLLQMTSLEVDSFVEQELLDNPTLERDDDGDSAPVLEEWDSALPDDGTVPSSVEDDDSDLPEQSAATDNDEDDIPANIDYSDSSSEIELNAQMTNDVDWDNYFGNYDNYNIGTEAGVGSDAPDVTSFENYIGSTATMLEQLEWQVQVGSEFSAAEREIASALIGALDERGYLQENITVVLAEELQVPVSDVEKVLAKLQVLDPVGIGARSLEECLRIQARELEIADPLVYEIIDNYLQDFSIGKVRQIARATGHLEPEVMAALHIIRQLEPVPARNFFYTPAMEARPDVTVRRVGDDYIVTVESGYGQLRISRDYQQMLSRRGRKSSPLQGEARDYLHEKLDRAKWLLTTLHSREDTLKLVMEAIIEAQRAYFDSGDSRQLKPLILRDIAARLEVNESTISRVTGGKFVMTDHGLLPLRFFFNSAVAADSGVDLSAEGVKKIIADMVKGENPDTPLSDQQMVEALKNQGLNIARRTVAKYREALNIPTAANRRKVF